MPSDERLDRTLRAVDREVERFRSSVARTLDEIRSRLTSRSQPAGADRWTAALGPMAMGRIDPERYAGILTEPEVLDPEAADRVEDALRVLETLEDGGASVFVTRLESGSDLRDAVKDALARLGRAFGAGRTAELARTGRFRPELHGSFLDVFPPSMWNRAEREIAPPQVVRLRGSDLRAAALAEYLDGTQKLILDVEGATPPAALVRLVTPGVLVLQTDEPDALERFGDFDGPAVAALFDRGARVARFVHDPRVEGGLARRLAVEDAPEHQGLRPVGAMTVAQQVQELEQLVALAGSRAAPGEASADSGEDAEDAVEPADRLAAWLLRQASMDDVNGSR